MGVVSELNHASTDFLRKSHGFDRRGGEPA